MTADDDRALVERVLGGEKAAFGLLIDRHRARAVALARRILGSADAEDVVQDALLSAFIGLCRLRDADRFESWLLSIVANMCRTRLRMRRELYYDDRIGGRTISEFSLEDAERSAEVIQETRELHRLIFKAIAALAKEQQDAVLLHYVEGLRLAEIAILTGSPLGTIKARLHHARGRLRASLASEIARESALTEKGGFAMIEVTVSDVVLRAPKYEEAKWLAEGKDYKIGFFRVILLKERDGDRILPIWVGPAEGDVIALLLEGLETMRPTTFDLTSQLLKVAGTVIEKVAVTKLRENIYYSTMWIRTAGQVHEIDARPSDAITLALKAEAPIFVSPDIFDQLGKGVRSEGDQIAAMEEQHKNAVVEGKIEAEPREMEWRSFRSLPRGEVKGLRARAR